MKNDNIQPLQKYVRVQRVSFEATRALLFSVTLASLQSPLMCRWKMAFNFLLIFLFPSFSFSQFRFLLSLLCHKAWLLLPEAVISEQISFADTLCTSWGAAPCASGDPVWPRLAFTEWIYLFNWLLYFLPTWTWYMLGCQRGRWKDLGFCLLPCSCCSRSAWEHIPCLSLTELQDEWGMGSESWKLLVGK